MSEGIWKAKDEAGTVSLVLLEKESLIPSMKHPVLRGGWKVSSDMSITF